VPEPTEDSPEPTRIAILGPGGVGGLLAAALHDAGASVTVVASESTAQKIARDGIELSSVRFGELVSRVRATSALTEPAEALIVATKAIGLEQALERIAAEPRLVLPLLNGLDHLALLRQRFAPETVLAGAIRVESDRPRPGVVVHTSPFLRIDMAGDARVDAPMRVLASTLEGAGVPTRVLDSEPLVMWGKLVRLNALACVTSAHDVKLGEILSTPALRAELVGAIEEATAVAVAEGAPIDAADPLAELTAAHPSLGSSMQRDIAAGRAPELDAIPGSVLRAAARHELACPTIEALVERIAVRAGVAPPRVG
jgi:2-dehydropantoate 2-reductase